MLTFESRQLFSRLEMVPMIKHQWKSKWMSKLQKNLQCFCHKSADIEQERYVGDVFEP